jgi:hypothetical protein
MDIIKQTTTIILFLLITAPLQAQQDHQDKDPKHYSKLATEAEMEYQTRIEIDSNRDLRLWRENRLLERAILAKIENQVSHMFGSLSHPPFGNKKAAPKTDHELEILQVEQTKPQLYEVTYHYQGTLLVEKGHVYEEAESLLFYLPNNPDRIYAYGLVDNKNPCTDPTYQSEGDFWYFWNPHNWGCPLIRGEHYHQVTGSLKRLPNTTISYPEYNRMVQNDEIPVFVIFGMNHQDEIRDPYEAAFENPGEYVNAPNYVNVSDWLVRAGYEKKLESFSELFLEKPDPQIDQMVTLESFTKATPKATLKFYLFYGPTGVNESESPLFHIFYLTGLHYASAVLYNGHSGLGGNLNMDHFDAIYQHAAPNPDQYQIYYFNSCSSYPYYNEMYFGRKITEKDPHGTKNLDIITNGLSTYFSVIDDTSLMFLRLMDAWAADDITFSFQDFANSADTQNLLGINGDEDNPTSAQEVQWFPETPREEHASED